MDCSEIKILAVEDDVAFMEILEFQMRSIGFSYATACSVDDALSKFMASPDAFDVLLADLLMPKSNGWELSQSILAQSPNIKVLYMSSVARASLVSHYGWPIPEDDFLRKPFDRDALRDKMLEVVAR